VSNLPLPRETSSDAVAPAGTSRLRSLDGLRGLAALVVVFHHLFQTLPTVADATLTGPGRPPVWSFSWWVLSTPAHILVAGPEAVLVFFVLSGFVVSLPVIRKAHFNWMSYYVQRSLRLYLPSIASVLLAALWILLSHQNSATATSSWTAGSSFPTVSVAQVVSAFDLLFGNIDINNPLWSLRWEVVFSLTLPLFVIIAIVVRRIWWAALLICWAAIVAGQHLESDSLRFLPLFLVGTILQTRMPEIQRWYGRMANRRGFSLIAVLAAAVSLLLIVLPWVTDAIWPASRAIHVASGAVVVVGAFGLVVCAALCGPLSAALSTRFFQWLGRISFSLYLVHVPVIIALSSVFGRGEQFIALPVALAASLLVGGLFARFVEQPSHRLSRAAGTAASSALARWFQPTPDTTSPDPRVE
jgi:peptidoglycan/LPS O-acetylase OafA/YrhL